MPTKRGSIPKMMPQNKPARTNKKSIPAGRMARPIPHSAEKIIVPGREYVQDIGALTTFALEFFSVNPRNTLLFPRLSAIASRYEKYRFTKLWFETESQAVTTDAGSVFHYLDPDPYDSAATSKAVVLNHQNSVRGKLYEDTCLKVNPEELKKVRYCRQLDEVSGDLREYDVGSYRIGALSSAAKVVGELFVNYEIEFISPTTSAFDTVLGPEDLYNGSDLTGTVNERLNKALNFADLAEREDSYLVPVPNSLTPSAVGGLLIQGIAEFVVELYAEGVGITGSPDLTTDSPAGEKKTIVAGESMIEGTTKLWKRWVCYFNNPSSVQSLLTFASLVASSISLVRVYIRPGSSASSPPPLKGFSTRRSRKRELMASLPTRAGFVPTPVAAVEPATLVAKSHGGTCVMLPDLSSPKASVPTPSPPPKYVFACTACDSFDPCCCKSLRTKIPYSCDNCRHPSCLGQCS